jgi:hypothetical protein
VEARPYNQSTISSDSKNNKFKNTMKYRQNAISIELLSLKEV